MARMNLNNGARALLRAEKSGVSAGSVVRYTLRSDGKILWQLKLAGEQFGSATIVAKVKEGRDIEAAFRKYVARMGASEVQAVSR